MAPAMLQKEMMVAKLSRAHGQQACAAATKRVHISSPLRKAMLSLQATSCIYETAASPSKAGTYPQCPLLH